MMADGHQKASWNHTLALAVGYGKAMGGKGPSILDLMPARYKPKPRKKTEEEEDAAAAFAFAGLECGLRAMGTERSR